MLKLTKLLELAGVKLGTWKIHCDCSRSRTSPLEAFFGGKFREWQEGQNQRNFQCDEIVSLVELGHDRWLFAGVFRVDGVKPARYGKKDVFRYKTTEIDGLDHLTGKAVITFPKNFRASYLRGARFGDDLVVSELLDRRMTIGEFPGYKSVLLSFVMLKTIIDEGNPSWKAALSNVAGVYGIVDTKTGKLYVGSAYGGHGIWRRWEVYAKTRHGGNKELVAIVGKASAGYEKNFQFTVLEVCDLDAGDDFVISRESHWKDVLLSRKFGMNRN